MNGKKQENYKKIAGDLQHFAFSRALNLKLLNTSADLSHFEFRAGFANFCKFDLIDKFLVPEMNIQNHAMCLYGAF